MNKEMGAAFYGIQATVTTTEHGKEQFSFQYPCPRVTKVAVAKAAVKAYLEAVYDKPMIELRIIHMGFFGC